VLVITTPTMCTMCWLSQHPLCAQCVGYHNTHYVHNVLVITTIATCTMCWLSQHPLCAQCVGYHNTHYVHNVLVITTSTMCTIVCSCNFASETQLISIRLAGPCIFHLIPTLRPLMTTCSEGVLFINWGVSLPKNKLNLHPSLGFETLLNTV